MTIALATNVLVQVDEVKRYLALEGTDGTVEDKIRELINAVSTEIEKACDRHFIKTTHTEIWNATGGKSIYAKNWPILDATDSETDPVVTFDDDADDTWDAASTYSVTLKWDKKTGEFYLKYGDCFWRGRRNIKFVYTAGYLNCAAIPADLKYCACKLVALRKIESDTGRIGVTSESVMDTNTSFTYDKWPQDVRDILNRYRRMSL